MPHHGRLAGDGALYVTYGDSPGPYSMYNGAVWKRTAAGTWTNITPLVPYTNGEAGFGYAGLAVDAQHPQTVMVATMGRWGPVDDIFRTTNGGTSWVSVTAHKTMDVSAAPYLAWHGTPKLGWMIGSLEIDPFNANRFLYGTGATVYGTDTATALDTGGGVTITSRASGLEETAVEDLISPPSGPPLISALGDIGVFRHDDIAVVPPGGMADNPVFGTASSLDFAQAVPSIVYRAGNVTAPAAGLAYSLDGGATWSPVASVPENPEGAGNVAVSADGNTVVWSPSQRGVYYSTNRGTTWTASTGVPGTTVAVRADRVNPGTFYAFVNGTFYVSTNGGASFAAAASGLPTGSTYFKPVPGAAGDIWLTTGYGGLYRSTNGGASFTHLGTVTEAYTVGFGKAAPGQAYPAVYLNGIVDGVNGLFRSDNAGATWVRINDDAHQWGWIGKTITGDPRVYGRVYVSTNGRGIVYGDRSGTSGPPDTSPPSTPGAPVASNVTATGAGLSWTASTDNTAVAGYDVLNAAGTVIATSATNSTALTGLAPSTQYVLRVRARDAAGNLSAASGTVTFTTAAPPGGGCAVTYTVTNSWSGAFQVDVSVRNTGTTPVNGWTLAWSYANGQAVYNLWNGAWTQSGANVAVTNLGYNATIAAGGTQGFGFQATWNNTANAKPASFTLNGTTCTSG
jgi:xyloglucan-specific exo-beta-1,4-glucanase